jgi:CRP/FNR family transcriptional regulator, cyclic AMP receptor protein
VTASEAAKVVRSVLCRGLTVEQTDQIVKAMVPVAVETGAVVLREGEKGQGLLVLLEGSAQIVKRGFDGADVLITTVEAPTVLGEMSLITERPHSATVRALTACEFQLLTRSQFDRLLKGENLAAYKVVATLAEVMAWRLSRMDDKVVELARRRDCPPPVEELAAFKHKLFSEWNF